MKNLNLSDSYLIIKGVEQKVNEGWEIRWLDESVLFNHKRWGKRCFANTTALKNFLLTEQDENLV